MISNHIVGVWVKLCSLIAQALQYLQGMVHVLWLLLVSAGWSEVKYMKREKLRNLIYGGCEHQDKLGASGRRVGRSTAPCPSPAGRDLHGWQNGEKTKIKVD